MQFVRFRTSNLKNFKRGYCNQDKDKDLLHLHNQNIEKGILRKDETQIKAIGILDSLRTKIKSEVS